MNDAFTSYLLRKFAREETLSLSVDLRQVTGVVDMQVNCLVLHISKGDKLEFFEHAFQRGQFELTHLSKHLRMIVPASNRKETKPHLSVDTALYTKGTPYISILARFVA
eukprot:CAMPEP_0198370110 /NCGR_PEP_ID=MMETSP1450-20131203/156551_1 /TAXON_ID=753684 ORGANISM="Madagascaria erythrocladiodes, Strain CCMP3234" /NCGR_SAMPLE_ID=MMETSP1450 /ASSEMBLY_ACC=CAM_ASM_001115 /LENGTH=108 /DNA_ID=CAMNT_0044077645 /DNA_START=321 /DNA_END=647 /DNA_ORIENTATION=-